MKDKDIILKYGTYMFLGFLAFFMIMKIFSLNYALNLRVLNGMIHVPLIYLAIREFRNLADTDEFNYFSGIMVGIKASLIGVFFFALFQLMFLTFDADFMVYIQENAIMGKYLNPGTASLVVFLEGMVVGVLASYVALRVVDNQKRRYTA